MTKEPIDVLKSIRDHAEFQRDKSIEEQEKALVSHNYHNAEMYGVIAQHHENYRVLINFQVQELRKNEKPS